MSFGTRKSGANSTDKKLIKRYVAAEWPVDKIANKLSLKSSLVARIIKFNKGKPADVEVETGKVETGKVDLSVAKTAKGK